MTTLPQFITKIDGLGAAGHLRERAGRRSSRFAEVTEMDGAIEAPSSVRARERAVQVCQSRDALAGLSIAVHGRQKFGCVKTLDALTRERRLSEPAIALRRVLGEVGRHS
jgi:hypothetical protein